MRRVRKVVLSWDEDSPEHFGVSYISEKGQESSISFCRFEDENIDEFLQRIGRACVSAAKGDLT